MILAAELVLTVCVASVEPGKLMVSESEDLSKMASPRRPCFAGLVWVLMLLVDIEAQMALAAVMIIPETLTPRFPMWS